MISHEAFPGIITSEADLVKPSGIYHRPIKANNDLEASAEFLKAYNQSRQTWLAYRKEISRFLSWCVAAKKSFSGISENELDDYRAFLAAPPDSWCRKPPVPSTHPEYRPFAGPLGDSSIKQAMTILGVFFGWLGSGGYLQFNPFRHRRGKHRNKPCESQEIERIIPKDLVHTVLDRLDEAMERIHLSAPRRKARARWIIALIFMSGLRRQEAADAKTADLRFKKVGNVRFWEIKIKGKGGKVRRVPLISGLVEEWQRMRAAYDLPALPTAKESSYLVPSLSGIKGVGVVTIYTELKLGLGSVAKLLESEGNPQSIILAKASTHWLRHTFGTEIVNGSSLRHGQLALGHADPRTTAIYSHTEMVELFGKMESAFSAT